MTTMRCSRNLTKHIEILKTQHAKMLTLHLNGYKIPNEMKQEYNEHLTYTRRLFQREKFKHYDKIIQAETRV